MKEKFLNLVKEIVMQVQEAQSPNYDGCKKAHSRHIILKKPKVKDKEKLLKAREKKLVTRWLVAKWQGEVENG